MNSTLVYSNISAGMISATAVAVALAAPFDANTKETWWKSPAFHSKHAKQSQTRQ